MALWWNLEKLTPPADYDIWIKNPNPNRPEEEAEIMNAVTEVLIFCTMFVGVNKITKNNYKEFHHRIEQWDIAVGGNKGLLYNEEFGRKRMPTIEEVKWHIGLETNADTFTKRQWTAQLLKLMDDTIEHRGTYELEARTANEGNNTEV